MKKEVLNRLHNAYTKVLENNLAKELVLKTGIGDYSIENPDVIGKVLRMLISDIEVQISEKDEKNEKKRSSTAE